MKRYWFAHGINTDSNDDSDWDNRANEWVESHTDDRATIFPYKAGTLWRWLRQGQRIKSLGGAWQAYQTVRPNDGIIPVGHSNGCAIIVGAVAKYPDVKLAELHLIAAAADADFDANGLNAAAARGQVGRIVLYCSRADTALRWARSTSWVRRVYNGWGYGSLGMTGPEKMSPAAAAITDVRWFDGFDHSTYFEPGNRFNETMGLVTGTLAA